MRNIKVNTTIEVIDVNLNFSGDLPVSMYVHARLLPLNHKQPGGKNPEFHFTLPLSFEVSEVIAAEIYRQVGSAILETDSKREDV